jgi:hypothetical protein
MKPLEHLPFYFNNLEHVFAVANDDDDDEEEPAAEAAVTVAKAKVKLFTF